MFPALTTWLSKSCKYWLTTDVNIEQNPYSAAVYSTFFINCAIDNSHIYSRLALVNCQGSSDVHLLRNNEQAISSLIMQPLFNLVSVPYLWNTSMEVRIEKLQVRFGGNSFVRKSWHLWTETASAIWLFRMFNIQFYSGCGPPTGRVLYLFCLISIY